MQMKQKSNQTTWIEGKYNDNGTTRLNDVQG